MLKKIFQPTLTIAIILVYIVIIAGSVVRMTGSGMGCPDWPKCFGYIIPPTEASQLDWKPNHDYKKGQVIIRNEELRIVAQGFTSAEAYNPINWNNYTKHDYAKFNPVHTWIEYVNRLATVLFGVPILLLVVCGFSFWKTDKRILVLALASLFSVAFEAWLGKIVVDTNLMPVKITLHVLFVFFIVAFLLWLRFISKPLPAVSKNKRIINLGYAAVVLTLIQVIIGTQVRQYIDVQMKANDYSNQSTWLSIPPIIFYVHRSFSILLVLVNLVWIWYSKKQPSHMRLMNWIGIVILLEALSGIVLYYLDFPFLSQPLHLLLASILFSLQFFCLLRLTRSNF